MKSLIDQLADAVHDEWSHWTKYFLENMTHENIERWKRQMVTDYENLSPEEKEKDRIWARLFYEIFRSNGLYKTDGCGMIVCGFPGVGKTELVKVNTRVVDHESSMYPKEDNWAFWYVQDAIVMMRAGFVVMVSSHDEVRRELARLQWLRGQCVFVYPEIGAKEEYRQRYISRGNNPEFVDMMMDKWERFIHGMDVSSSGCNGVVLRSGEYLSDACDRICQMAGIGEPSQISR